MSQKLKEFSEATLVPVSLVLVIVSGVIWISGVAATAKEAQSLAAECAGDFKIIEKRLSRIEGYLNKGDR